MVPPPLTYLAAFGAGSFIERASPSPGLPGWLRVTGGAAGGLALIALDTGAMLRFRRGQTPVNPARPARRLITTGPYRFTRNPMYAGMACAYAGAALATERLWSLALLPLVLATVDRAIIPREEAHLLALFGDDYERYRRRVRRWL